MLMVNIDRARKVIENGGSVTHHTALCTFSTVEELEHYNGILEIMGFEDIIYEIVDLGGKLI